MDKYLLWDWTAEKVVKRREGPVILVGVAPLDFVHFFRFQNLGLIVLHHLIQRALGRLLAVIVVGTLFV